MDKIAQKKELLQRISAMEGDTFKYNEAAILEAYKKQTENTSSVAIKILSIFGGLLAVLFFLGFLALAGLYDSKSGLLIFGSLFIIAAIVIDKKISKLIMDTISIALYSLGFLVLGFGLSQLRIDDQYMALIFMAIALAALLTTPNYIIAFTSTVLISACLLYIIISNEAFNFIHLYLAGIAALLVYVFLNEAKLLTYNRALATLYNPLKVALIFSLLLGLLVFNRAMGMVFSIRFLWLSSVILIAAILWIMPTILNRLEVTKTSSKVFSYGATVLLLATTLFSPTLPGAFLIILLSVLVRYKTGLVIGIIAFIYFIMQFYYDLFLSLLTKSILLMSSGVVFIGLYVFISKKLKSDEKL